MPLLGTFLSLVWKSTDMRLDSCRPRDTLLVVMNTHPTWWTRRATIGCRFLWLLGWQCACATIAPNAGIDNQITGNKSYVLYT